MASESWSFSDSEEYAVPRETDSPASRDVDVILANLDALAKEEALLTERRRSEIAELASLFSHGDGLRLRDAVTDFAESHFRTLDRPSRTEELLLLCRALTRKRNAARSFEERQYDADEIFSAPRSVSAKASGRVAYLHNRFTDEAFTRLTAHMEAPRAAYFTSFTDVCEEVYHGLCEFCMLPVESTSAGKLLRFYALIEKYELKIAAVSTVKETDEGSTVYALLRHRYVPLVPLKRSNSEYLAEFSFVSDSDAEPIDVLRAAETCGMRLSRMDSLPQSSTENEARYNCVFSLPNASSEALSDVEAFSLYLSVMLPEYVPIGIYPKIISYNQISKGVLT